MSKKAIISIIVIIAIIMGILTGYYIYKINNVAEPQNEETTKLSLKIEDECTEFAIALEENQNSITANSTEEKISPNAELIIKKHYKKCNHTIKEYVELPKELVNKTYAELKQEYIDWEIEQFSPTKITLYKQEEGTCNQHYIIKQENGYIVIYTIDENGNETHKQKTEIATQYLPRRRYRKITRRYKSIWKRTIKLNTRRF